MEAYIQSLLGTPYVWWHSGTILGDCKPFWNSNMPPPSCPEGANCAGFVNLVCRHLGIPIPGVAEGDPWAGGTWYWFRHGDVYPVPPGSASYKPGTLLLRDYADAEKDQGHIGIVLEGGRLAHCIPGDGVIIERLGADVWWTHASDYMAARL